MTPQKKISILTTLSLMVLLVITGSIRIWAQAEYTEYKNAKGFVERDYGNGIVMVHIPAGKFSMGALTMASPMGNVHRVHLDGYWIGKHEVTMAQYKTFVSKTGYKPLPEFALKFSPGENYPAIGVSWEDATAYCKWLSGKLGVNVKLPTEAQWEKAARGTEKRQYPWGEDEPDKTRANFGNHVGTTSAVGSYPEGISPYGLLDMAGNVFEWCRDWYDSRYYLTPPDENPTGPGSGINRVLRGGSWSSGKIYLRCASRYSSVPTFGGAITGFRLCQEGISKN